MEGRRGGMMGTGGNGRTPNGVTTTSDGVRTSYYGLPVIKAPHWRWLIIVYFFLGGLAGGGFSIAALADLFAPGRASTRKIARVGRYLSFAALIPSPVLLALDLGRPERALHMLRIVKLRSPMSLGSWALVGLGMASPLAAALQAWTDLRGAERTAALNPLRRAVNIAGLPFAFFVSGYTGLLLAVTNVPLWARNYLLLGPTFMASAFSSSFAAISLVLTFDRGGPAGKQAASGQTVLTGLARAEALALSTELALLTAGLIRLGRLSRPLTTPPWGLLFWPVTFLGGVVTPLILQLSGPVQGREGASSRRRLAAVLALAGSFSLRTVMIFAGRESARRPEDYFAYTNTRT